MHIPPRMYEFFITFKTTIELGTQDFLSPAYTTVVEEQDAKKHGIGLPNFLSEFQKCIVDDVDFKDTRALIYAQGDV